MSKIGVIVSGGQIDKAFVDSFFETIEPEVVIAADSGMRYLYESGKRPTHIVGDFDSVARDILDYYRSLDGIAIRQYNPVKDATDTEIAIRYAIELGVEKLWILGGTGSRIDHMLGNIQCLKIAKEENVEAYIVDGYNRVRLLGGDACIRKEDLFGPYFSVFPLGGEVKNVSIKGAKYPLHNHTLTPYDSRCVSNQPESETIQITFSEGDIIFVESKDEK